MKMICAEYFCDWTMFNPLMAVDFCQFTQNFIFFDTIWRTLVDVTFSCVLKVCRHAFELTKKRNFKIGQAQAEI